MFKISEWDVWFIDLLKEIICVYFCGGMVV